MIGHLAGQCAALMCLLASLKKKIPAIEEQKMKRDRVQLIRQKVNDHKVVLTDQMEKVLTAIENGRVPENLVLPHSEAAAESGAAAPTFEAPPPPTPAALPGEPLELGSSSRVSGNLPETLPAASKKRKLADLMRDRNLAARANVTA